MNGQDLEKIGLVRTQDDLSGDSHRKSAWKKHAIFIAKLLISALVLAPAYMCCLLAAVFVFAVTSKAGGYGFVHAFFAFCLLFCPTTWLQFWSGYNFWGALKKTVTGYAIAVALICCIRLLGL
jgi:hypothetical protein